jgi:hypothetical protein
MYLWNGAYEEKILLVIQWVLWQTLKELVDAKKEVRETHNRMS